MVSDPITSEASLPVDSSQSAATASLATSQLSASALLKSETANTKEHLDSTMQRPHRRQCQRARRRQWWSVVCATGMHPDWRAGSIVCQGPGVNSQAVGRHRGGSNTGALSFRAHVRGQPCRGRIDDSVNVLSVDCCGQQCVLQVCIPIGELALSSVRDLGFIAKLQAVIEEAQIPLLCSIEQRWTARSTARPTLEICSRGSASSCICL